MGRCGLCLCTEANTWTGSVSGGRSSHWLHPPSSGLSSQVVILGPLQILTPSSRLSQRWTALGSILTVLQMPPLSTSSELLYLLYYRFWDLRGNASPGQLEGTSTYFKPLSRWEVVQSSCSALGIYSCAWVSVLARGLFCVPKLTGQMNHCPSSTHMTQWSVNTCWFWKACFVCRTILGLFQVEELLTSKITWAFPLFLNTLPKSPILVWYG